MGNSFRYFWLFSLIAAFLVLSARAHAKTAEEPPARTDPAGFLVPCATCPGAMNPMRDVRTAEGLIEQAALQRDFSSNARELTLLRGAHDALESAIDSLCCMRRERAAVLAADLDHVLVRDAAHDGFAHSVDGFTYGPPAPSRDQLARLASEAWDLVRGAPLDHRPILFTPGDLPSDWIPPRASTRTLGYGATGARAWPLGSDAPVDQFHFLF
jgi:hypothetical protein